MDPFFSPRGPRSGSYIPPGYSPMHNLFDQNLLSEEPFNQGQRLNHPSSESFPYHLNMGSERNTAPFAETNASDHFLYDRYIPTGQLPIDNQLVHNAMFYDAQDKSVRNLSRNNEQTSMSGMVDIENSFSAPENVSHAHRMPSIQNLEDYDQDNNSVQDFSQQGADVLHVAITNNSFKEHTNSYAGTKHTDNCRDMTERNKDNLPLEAERTVALDSDQQVDTYESIARADDSGSGKEMSDTENAVDLSKTSILDESLKNKNILEGAEKIAMEIKQEHFEDYEMEEKETDSDDDKTIIDEPVKEKSGKPKKSFKCKECDKAYSSSSTLKKHQNIHAGVFRCKICSKSWSSKYALTQHEKVHTGEKEGSLCNICGKTFFDASSLSKHHKSVHEGLKSYSCEKCNLKFYARKTLVEHIRVHTGERPFKCTICPKTYKRISDLNHHIRGHTGETKHVCDVCGKGVRRLSELKVHMHQHRNDSLHVKKSDIVCSWCGKTFKNRNDLNSHTKEHYQDVLQKGFDENGHGSSQISAAEDLGTQHNLNDKFQASNKEKRLINSETSPEAVCDRQQIKKLYQYAGAKPQRQFNYILNSCMPISDASFHSYFPLPAEEEPPAETEPGEVLRSKSDQITSEQRVNSWLNSHFSSSPDTLQSKVFVSDEAKEPECYKDNQKQDIPQQTNEKDSYVIAVKDIHNDLKTGLTVEKQKSIANVVDFLAEKAKDLTNSDIENDEEIKAEISDGGETDDYDIEDKVEEIKVNESPKKTTNRKAAEKPNTKSSVKVNSKSKQSKKRQRKKTPKKIQKSTQKLDQTQEDDSINLDLQSIKSKPKQSKKRQRKKIPKKIEKSTKLDPKLEDDSNNLDNKSVKSENNSEINDFPPVDRDVMKDGLHLCTDCGKTFQSRAAYKNHKDMHSGSYTCPQCNRSLSSSWSLRQHILTHTSLEERARFPCNVCSKLFCDKSSVNKHVKTVHMNFKPYKCTECDMTFSEQKTMREHIRTHTGERPFLCMYCPKTFKRASELNHHIRGHTGETKHTCDTCGRGFRRLSELLRHMTLHTEEKPHKCKYCGKDFRSFSVMREHALRHFGTTAAKHVCERCGRRFFQKLKLLRHVRANRECSKCRYCLKEIPDPLDRERHEETHEGDMKYVCTVCEKHFRGRGALNKHVRIHSQNRCYVCEQCGASFIQSNHLKQHVRTHTGEKPYVCLMCGKPFAQSGTLYSHMKTHLADPAHQKKGGVFHCSYDSEDSIEDDVKSLGPIQDAVNLIETKVV